MGQGGNSNHDMQKNKLNTHRSVLDIWLHISLITIAASIISNLNVSSSLFHLYVVINELYQMEIYLKLLACITPNYTDIYCNKE